MKILCVDDEPDLLDLLAETLEIEGYDVDTAPNGEAAFERISQETYSAVISDICMPKVNGIELLKKIRETQSEEQLKVFLITGFANYTEKDVFKHGGQALLLKPEDISRLGDVLVKFNLNAE